MNFKDLGLSDSLLKAVADNGYSEPTAIQTETIPLTLKGEDVIGQAQTGTGKTAAFALPILQGIDVNDPNVQALVISPTRELAIQTQKEIQKLGRGEGVRAQVVYGGSDIRKQIYDLKKKPQIIVGTPGRLLDHIKRRTLKLEHVKFLVLDEADEMLNMGFIDDINAILEKVPENRQMLLFSATMPPAIRKIATKFMKNPKEVKIKSKEMTVENIEQYFVKTQEREKFDILTRLLDVHQPELAIVFGRTKRRVDELAQALNIRGYLAEGIHGDLSQSKRLSVLRQFKENKIDILVATDVAARGLDISGVSHVYNFDIPQDPESYVHRIGRTGRAGKSGLAVTFVTPREMGYLRIVEETTNKRMTPLRPPTEDEALAGQQKLAIEKLVEVVQANDLKDYRLLATELLEDYDAVDLIAAAIKSFTKEPDDTPVKITEERPLPIRKERSNGRSGGRSVRREHRGSRREGGKKTGERRRGRK